MWLRQEVQALPRGARYRVALSRGSQDSLCYPSSTQRLGRFATPSVLRRFNFLTKRHSTAHEFYGKNADSSNAVFPNNPLPDYWDFISFAFVIGLRIQAPRVQITSKKMRRVVIVQCLVSFILNLSIFMLATTIVVRRYW
jgi:hypothetical protein